MISGLEDRLDRLFGWVDGKAAQKWIKRLCGAAFVYFLLMMARNFDTIIDIWNGTPSP